MAVLAVDPLVDVVAHLAEVQVELLVEGQVTRLCLGQWLKVQDFLVEVAVPILLEDLAEHQEVAQEVAQEEVLVADRAGLLVADQVELLVVGQALLDHYSLAVVAHSISEVVEYLDEGVAQLSVEEQLRLHLVAEHWALAAVH